MGLYEAGELLTKRYNILHYGGNRTGKSYLLGTAYECPELQPMMIINGDFSTTTYARHFPKVPVYIFEEGKSIKTQMDDVAEIVKQGKYQFVGLDNVSTLMNQFIRELTKNGQAQQQHWNVLFITIQSFIEKLIKRVPFFAATALPNYIRDNNGNIIKIVPYVMGEKFPVTFNSLFDTITWLELDEFKGPKGPEQKRVLRAVVKKYEEVGDRNGLISEIPEPTYKKILEQIKYTKEQS